MSAKFLRALAIAACAFPLTSMLTGCDPQPAGPTPASGTSLTITPSLGLVRNATVVVRNASNTVVGTGNTGATGTLTVHVTGRGPFVVEVLGDADADYFDESTGTFRPYRAPRSIHALVPVGATAVGVTGLTDLAHALWAANSVPLSATNVTQANEAVRQALAPVIGDLLTPPTRIGATPAAGSLTTSAGDIYAALLAGLAELGAGETSPALAALDQLRSDIADGNIDGMIGSTVISNLLYSGGIATEFQAAVATQVSAWGNSALQGTSFTVNALVEPTWGGSGGGGGNNGVPATVSPGLVGSYNLVFFRDSRVSATDSPLVDGQSYPVTVSANGTFTILGSSYTNPFARAFGGTPNLHEAIWLAGTTEYALSDNVTGTFNEINVGDATHPDQNGIPRQLGQLRQPDLGPDLTPLIQLAGSHPLTRTTGDDSFPGISPAIAAGDTSLTLNIDANGVITIPRINQTFDPTTSGNADFQSALNSLEPHVVLTKTLNDNGTAADASDDTSLSLYLYIDSGTLVGAQLEHSAPCGFSSGCFAVKRLEFEVRPIAVAHQDFINDLLATGFPQDFTVIQRTGNGVLPALCTTFSVAGVAGVGAGSAPLTLTINGFRQPWEASVARVTGNDASRTLKLYLFNVVLDDLGNVRLEERSGGTVQAVASNRAGDATAAGCSSGGGSGTLASSAANPVTGNQTLTVTRGSVTSHVGSGIVRMEGADFIVRVYYNPADGDTTGVQYYWGNTDFTGAGTADNFVSCTGLCGVSINRTAGTLTFTNTTLAGSSGNGKAATLNGTATVSGTYP